MRIGELSAKTGVSTRSLRYYEQRGLLTSSRRENGYREYDSGAVQRIRNVRRLLDDGLTSADIRELGACLSEDLDRHPFCPEAVELYERRLESVEERARSLREVGDTLRHELGVLRGTTSDETPNGSSKVDASER